MYCNRSKGISRSFCSVLGSNIYLPRVFTEEADKCRAHVGDFSCGVVICSPPTLFPWAFGLRNSRQSHSYLSKIILRFQGMLTNGEAVHLPSLHLGECAAFLPEPLGKMGHRGCHGTGQAGWLRQRPDMKPDFLSV